MDKPYNYLKSSQQYIHLNYIKQAKIDAKYLGDCCIGFWYPDSWSIRNLWKTCFKYDARGVSVLIQAGFLHLLNPACTEAAPCPVLGQFSSCPEFALGMFIFCHSLHHISLQIACWCLLRNPPSQTAYCSLPFCGLRLQCVKWNYSVVI